PILRIIEIRAMQMFGVIPSDLSVEFKPLRVLSAEQEENCKTQKFNRLIQARQAGEIDSITFREACNKQNLLGVMLDVEDDDLAGGGYEDDDIEADGNEDDDTDDPGTARTDTMKPTARSNGGAPEGAEKASGTRSGKVGRGGRNLAPEAPSGQPPRAKATK